MDEQKKPVWPFWTAISLVALPMLYVLSLGPVAKLCQLGVIDDDTMIRFSAPFMVVLRRCPEWVVSPFAQYLALWGGSL